jgi:hypothetical protein
MSGTKTLVTTEAIHAFLVAHPGSTFQRVQDAMHCSFTVAKRLLDQMRRDGLITTTPNGGFYNSYLFWPAEAPDLPPPPTVAQSRTPPEFKPLALDMGKFMRLCQGARNSQTGVV